MPDSAVIGWITVIHVRGFSLFCLATRIRRDRSEKICRGPGRGLIENAGPHPPGGRGRALFPSQQILHRPTGASK